MIWIYAAFLDSYSPPVGESHFTSRLLGATVRSHLLASVLVNPAACWNTRMDVLFRNPDSANRVWIAVARLVTDIDLHLVHWARNMRWRVVSDHMLCQTRWCSQWNVWWSRQPDRSSRDWNSVVGCVYAGDHAR